VDRRYIARCPNPLNQKWLTLPRIPLNFLFLSVVIITRTIGVGIFSLVPRPINNNASTAPSSPPFLKHTRNAFIHLVSTNNANIPIPTQSINQSFHPCSLQVSMLFALCFRCTYRIFFAKENKKKTYILSLILNPAYDIVRFHLPLLDFLSSGSLSLSFTLGIFWHLRWVPLAVYSIRFPLWVFFLLHRRPFIVVVFLPNQYSFIRSIRRRADNTSHTESLI